ncbi:MAG: DNA-binding domain-containing protein [Caldimonas sp.]
MPALPEMQARFLDALLAGGALPTARAVALLRDGDGVSAMRRLQVYRNNVQASLRAALEAVYPVVARLVGAACFADIARRFIPTYPSRSGNLHDFGRELPDFLRSLPALDALPYLGDVAALEWACHEVYHEADDGAFDPAVLADVPLANQPSLRLALQPALRFVESPYPVLAIWQANQPDSAASVHLDQGGVQLLVARRDDDIEFRSLGAAEACWLRTLVEERPLAEAVVAALALDPGFDFGAVLARHLRLGTFCRVWLPTDRGHEEATSRTLHAAHSTRAIQEASA